MGGKEFVVLTGMGEDMVRHDLSASPVEMACVDALLCACMHACTHERVNFLRSSFVYSIQPILGQTHG